MTRAKAVVFDLGKVLVDFDYSIAGQRIAARSRMSAAEVQSFIDHSPLLFRFETGQMSKEQFFAEVQSASSFEGTFDEFTELFADIFTPIEAMLELHAALRRSGVPTYLFSNTNELAVGHIRRHFPFFSQFNGHICSYEHGAMKPDARLYEVVERTSRLGGAELLYLDDRPENVAAGAARGWQAVVHENPEASQCAVVGAGLLRGPPASKSTGDAR
jgi:HAD superfamily hydrolase (TIGR01509 family)